MTFQDESTLGEIGDYAFFSAGIVDLVLPSSVTKVGNNAFDSCTALYKIRLPGITNPNNIGGDAFSWAGRDEIYIGGDSYPAINTVYLPGLSVA